MTHVRRAVKNVVGNYSDIQVKVREATSNDPWGPSGALMSDIADATFNVMAFDEIIGLLWKRLNDSGKNWRHVYKALVVVDYILKTGSGRVAEHCKDNIFTIQTLKDFVFVDKEDKDQGINIREKSKQLVALLKDQERLGYERSKAIKAKERFHASTPVGSANSTPRRRNSTDGSHGRVAASPQPSTPNNLAPSTAAAPGSQSWQASRRAASSTPTRSDTRQSNVSSEISRAKPTSQQEEALQLELALALSRQEADKATKDKEDEESQLRCVLQATAPPEPFFSANPSSPGNDPWGGAGAPATAAASAPAASSWENFDEGKRAAAVANTSDPWGPSGGSSAAPAGGSSPRMFPANGFGSPATNSEAPKGFDAQPLNASMGSMQLGASPRSPESVEKKFLGDNGTLVSLNTFNGSPAAVAQAAGGSSPSANPFVSAPPAGTGMRAPVGNPFEKGKPQGKSLNQMRTMDFTTGDAGTLLPPPLLPESQGEVRRASAPMITPGLTIPPSGMAAPQPMVAMVPMAAPYGGVIMTPVMMPAGTAVAGMPMQTGMQPMPMMQPAPMAATGGNNPFMPAAANASRNGNLFF